MLDPHRLRVFRAVVSSGGVQAAADNLGLTSSAVSQHLAALARETGLTLFQRQGRGIVPTQAGVELADQSEEAMSQWGRLDSVVADLREGRTGRLTVGYFASAGSAWMPALVKELTAEMSDLTVDLVLTEVTSRNVTPDIDIITDLPDSPPRAGYRRVYLANDPYVAVVARDHELASQRSVALADLRGETWVSNDLVGNPGHKILVQACAAAGFTPRFTVQAQDHYSAIQFAAAGVGVSVMPRLAARSLPPEVTRLRITDPAPVREIAAMVRETGRPNPAAERMLEMLIDLNTHPARRGRPTIA
ncbi:LysR family transcriptional regulator [Knoellia sinensis KCTC 19936]|uniref:LysR family transcriptional regulator n=1 Tax=Knoellia sinensis KCTC 19936 TaxID=1385520 RepID=A0A0A0J9J6_9MICO|nr:LysR family transcriptional regulator [Knoellia sinensis]KGN34085.1 LysR family transcriptional regulator [Knoellia sinensis KCTC 19936]